MRPAADFEGLRVPGARRFDPSTATGLPEGTGEATEFIVIGRDPDDTGVRQASHVLRAAGARRVVEVPGGLREWRQLGLPLEDPDQRAA